MPAPPPRRPDHGPRDSPLDGPDLLPQAVLDGISAFVGILSTDGTLLWANRAPLEAAGLCLDQVVGKTLWETPWWDEDHGSRDRLRDVCLRAASQHISSRYDSVIRVAGGRPMAIEFMVSPILDHDGETAYLIASAIDIDERKAAEEALRASEERLMIAQRAGTVGVFDWDLDSGRIVWTAELERIFGLAPGSFDGSLASWMERVVPEDRPALEAHFRDCLADPECQDPRWEHRIRLPDGRGRWIEGRGRIIRDPAGRPLRMIGTKHDITESKDAERALRESEARAHLRLGELEAVYRSAPVGLCVLDRDFRFVRINERLAQMNGLPAEAHLGRSVAEILPDLWPIAEPSLRRILATGEPVPAHELRGTTPARPGVERVWIESWYPIRSPSGDIVGINVVTEDVTERKHAEEALRASEARFRELADSMPQIVWTSSADGTVDYFNRRWVEFTGRSVADGLGSGWRASVHPDDADRTRKAWDDVALHGLPFQVEHRIRREDGSYRWLLSRAFASRDEAGNVTKWYGTATDIDDQKRAEAALEEADRLKDDFLAMMAHELRNPLAAVRNATEILRAPAVSPDQRRWAHGAIDRQLEHLARMLDDLLDVARVRRGLVRLRQERIDARDVLSRAIDSVRPIFDRKRLALSSASPPEPVFVHADPTRLEQILVNLLSNASKFTPPGGHISASCALEDGRVVLRVADDGQGIDPQLLPHVFDLFTQAQTSLDREQGGLGLGLSLVRQLVELHGGRVEARSAGPGLGSEFLVELQPADALAPGPTTGEITPSPTPQASPRQRVLVVDDNVDTAHSLAWLLEAHGYQTRTAFDGPSALDAARDFRPHVALLDLGLPRLDGYQVAEQMRRDPRLRDALLVAVSGYGREDDLLRSRAAGFDLHLVKPVDINDLLRRISAHCLPS